MKRPIPSIIILVIAVLTGSFVIYTFRHASVDAISNVSSQESTEPVHNSNIPSPAATTPPVRTARSHQSATIHNHPTLGYGLIAAQVRSWALKLQPGITETQIQAVYDAYCAIHEQRLAYEASIASSTTTAEHEVLIEIPAYPELGEKLRETLNREIAKAIGPSSATKLLAVADQELSDASAAWGKHEQTLLVRYDSNNVEYTVTHRTRLTKGPHDLDAPVRVSLSSLKPNNLNKYSLLSDHFPSPNKNN